MDNIFSNIDSKLNDFSQRLDAKITKDRSSYPAELRTFQERRIELAYEGLQKAILIQPVFTSNGVDSSRWNFIIIAYKDAYPVSKQQKVHFLIKEQAFDIIEENIDDLLKSSEKFLINISEGDFK